MSTAMTPEEAIRITNVVGSDDVLQKRYGITNEQVRHAWTIVENRAWLGIAAAELCKKYALEPTAEGVKALGNIIEYERENAIRYKAAWEEKQ